ncbi:hypothetical protein K435DRAFT_800800 [Dendrothele bispora CBS 962.96]|uniref:SWIM-type domain-containing protein n=1 Tax=Dendrothele bispora (strain CBS 962.96) TaxID=1314807 RepID=A0A4S8LRH1_DENBC|nr:hypothetical protein K435DRAFT_800800 [Dendrothele bispora CBS 962.96]
MSSLVAYTSLTSTAPNQKKGKGKEENYEERTRHDSRLQVSRIQMRLARHMSRSSSSARYCDSPQNRGKCNEGEYEKESTVKIDDICCCPNDLKGNHCKHIFFIFTKLLQVQLGSASIKINRRFSLLHLALHYNSEVLMLMKESSEIKGKSLDKDLYYERPFGPFKSSNEKQAR